MGRDLTQERNEKKYEYWALRDEPEERTEETPYDVIQYNGAFF